MSKLTQFAKFVGRYAGELRGVAGLLGTVLNALPINPADRSDAARVLDDLNAAADRIEGSLSSILADGVINRDDLKVIVRDVVKELLPDIVGGLTERNTRAAVTPPAPAAPAPAPRAPRPPRSARRLPTATETTGD